MNDLESCCLCNKPCKWVGVDKLFYCDFHLPSLVDSKIRYSKETFIDELLEGIDEGIRESNFRYKGVNLKSYVEDNFHLPLSEIIDYFFRNCYIQFEDKKDISVITPLEDIYKIAKHQMEKVK